MSGNSQQDTVAATLDAPYVVRVTDGSGNPVAGVTVTWAVTAGGGTIAPASTDSDAQGETRATHTLGTTAGAQSATASAAGLQGSPVTFTATALHGNAAALVYIQQPTNTPMGQTISPAVRAAVRDQFGNLATGFTGSVALSITPGTGTPLATLSGTLTRTPSQGVATFNDLRIDLVGLGYRLRAEAVGITADSAPFDVTLLSGSVINGSGGSDGP